MSAQPGVDRHNPPGSLQTEQRAIRAENRESRGLLLSLAEQLRQLGRRIDDVEPRIVEQRDDVER